jgi:hypothetical protein
VRFGGQAWEQYEMLPTINSCFGVFFPFCLSGWISISYPVDLILRLVVSLVPTARKRLLGPAGIMSRRRFVERVGLSLACR